MQIIYSNIIALLVVVPLMAAPICALLKSEGKGAWIAAASATWISFVFSIVLFIEVYMGGPVSYAMGGWKAPYGIEYKADLLNSIVLVLVSAIGAITIFYARDSVEHEIDSNRRSYFYATYLLCLAGLLGITVTNDTFNIYVFLEISSLAMYGLIAMGKDRRALMASFEYLILGTIGATFILIAVGLLYMMTGTLNISDLAERLYLVENNIPIIAAVAFFTIGLALKIAMFPMHLWLANGYTNAPSFVSSFLAATGTKVSIYLLIRVLFTLFGYEFSFKLIPISNIFMTIAVFGIFVGSLVAIFQHNVKRLLAYSSVAQVGYIILGIGIASVLGLASSVVHVLNHALTKGALFMAVGCVAMQSGGVRLVHFKGVGKTMPYTMAAFVIAGLGLIGFPLTAGFISKYYLIMSALEVGNIITVVVVILGSLMAIIYIWKVVEMAYFNEADKQKQVKEAPISMLIPLWIMTLSTIVFGIYTEYTAGVAEKIATFLLEGKLW